MIPVFRRSSRVELESRRFRKRMTDRFIGLRTGFGGIEIILANDIGFDIIVVGVYGEAIKVTFSSRSASTNPASSVTATTGVATNPPGKARS